MDSVPRDWWYTRSVLVGLAFLLYCYGLYQLTLTGTGLPDADVPMNFVPLSTVVDTIQSPLSLTGKIYVLLGNAVVFVPLAFFIMLATRRLQWKLALSAFVVVGVGIECGQFLLDNGRSIDIDDLILNAAGGAFAFWVICRSFPRARGWALRRQRAKAGSLQGSSIS